MALSRVLAPPILTERSGRPATALRYVVTVVCAASAGVHAALVQPHVEEAGPLLGAAFAAASLALAVTAVAVRQPSHDAWAPAAAAIVLGLLAISYLLSRTTGLPLLITDREELDPLGVLTTGAEFIGALAAAVLIRIEETA
jgi:peptidoglycan/LPS O-acetylase OafA/YrhL